MRFLCIQSVFRLSSALVATSLLTCTFTPTHAANVTLTATDGFGTSSFDTAGNWDNFAPPSGGNDYFTSNFGIRTPNNSAAPGVFAGDSLTINAGGALITKHAFGATATINQLNLAGGTIGASTGTGGGAQQMYTGTLSVTANSTISLGGTSNRRLTWVNGTMNGSGNINMTGANNQNDIFFLNGTNGNAHTGSWTVSAGRLIAGGGNALGDTSAITINGGGNGALDVRGSETIGSLAGNGRVRIVSGGPFTLTTGGNNSSTTFSGILQNALSIEKLGTGTMTLSGANTHTGTTTVERGNLQISNSSALGTAAGGTVISGLVSNVELRMVGNINVAAEPAIPGLHEMTVPGFSGMADITYHVQLPPEYDPYKRYPAIVTMHG